MGQPKTYADYELRYAATARCTCGAGFAYPRNTADFHGQWECADILTGRAVPADQPDAKVHDRPVPFAFYELKSEDQPSANGRTTRPAPLSDVDRTRQQVADLAARLDALDGQIAQTREQLRRVEEEREETAAHARAAHDALIELLAELERTQ